MDEKMFKIEMFNEEIEKLKGFSDYDFEDVFLYEDENIDEFKERYLSFQNDDLEEKEENLIFDGMEFFDINDCVDCLSCPSSSILRSEEEVVAKYADVYFKAALGMYVFYEYKYSRFGNWNYLSGIDFLTLYLCGKYFESKNELNKAHMSYFVVLASSTPYFEDDDDLLGLFEKYFDSFKEMFEADWLALHPRIAHMIGKYYLKKENYERAFEFFELGSSISYEGRQSIEPFIEVGKNEYELGNMYYKGLGVDVDYEEALSYFEQAANDFGEGSLPIIGDMYYFGQGVDRNTDQAINSYLSFNKYNLNQLIEYKNLTPEQKERTLGLIKDILSDKNSISYSNLIFIGEALKYRIENQDILDEIEKTKYDLLMNTPLNERDSAMENDYVELELRKLKETLSSPTENTGFIPNELKVGDVFTFGKFNGEPLNWKVLEFNKDGSAYVITTDIIAKMSYDKVFKWLNEEFINYSFTAEEKEHIKPHGYSQFYKGGDTYLYLASSEQLEQFEGTYKSGTIKQTKFAKSLAKSSNVLCLYSGSIDSKGKSSRYMDSSSVEGIRPAMDVYYK